MGDKEQVDHPSHYGGADNPYEAIKIIEHFKLGFCLGNCIKYILRAGKKDPAKHIEDLRKAKWYLEREITNLEAEQESRQTMQQQIERLQRQDIHSLGRTGE